MADSPIMNKQTLGSRLSKILDQVVNYREIFGAVVSLESGDGSFSWLGAAGNIAADDQYFIASTTKLYTTAVILKLRAEGLLNLDDLITKYIDAKLLTGIQTYKGVDYSNEITISQLMSHTSGIPDYFQGKGVRRKSLENELTGGNDQGWDFEKVLTEVKKMKPTFKPGEKGKALYSDTNYQLLGKIIEVITEKSVNTVFQEYLFNPLQLTKTYLYTNSSGQTPVPLYYKKQPLHIHRAMASFGPDGGIVSTASESMLFIKAFFNGFFFPIEYFNELKNPWNRIFFPLEYGIGIMRFKLPRLFSPFKPIPEFIGHSGLSGAFEYYCPDKDIYLAGTVNQIANPSLSYKLMIKLINCFD